MVRLQKTVKMTKNQPINHQSLEDYRGMITESPCPTERELGHGESKDVCIHGLARTFPRNSRLYVKDALESNLRVELLSKNFVL